METNLMHQLGLRDGQRVTVDDGQLGRISTADRDDDGHPIHSGQLAVEVDNGQGTWGYEPAEVKPAPTGVVVLSATIHVAVQDGEVVKVSILPASSGTLWEGDPEAVDCLETSAWLPLAGLPKDVKWEG